MEMTEDFLNNYCTLDWGIPVKECKQLADKYNVHFQYKKPTTQFQGIHYIYFGHLHIQQFSGDCGMLTIGGGNYANSQALQCAEEYASRSGYDKLLLSIAFKTSDIDMYLDRFKTWTIIHRAPSNRNPQKTSVVFFKHIPNCIKKGY